MDEVTSVSDSDMSTFASTMILTSTNTTLHSTTSSPEDDQGWGVGTIENMAVVRTVYGFIAIIGILGNFIVCLALIRNATLRTRTSHFIIHLAVTDLLTSFWIIPFNLFPRPPDLADNIGGEIVCRLYSSKFPLWCTIFASVYSLVTVTIERYFAVVHPIKFKIFFRMKWCVLMMAATWVIGFASNVYFFLVYDAVDGACVFTGYASVAAQRIVGVYTFSAVYVVPVAITLYCHRKMIISLKKQMDAMRKDKRQNRAAGHKSKRDENAWQLKATNEIQKTLFVVLVTYMICWAPNQFIFFAYNLGAKVDFAQPYYHVSVMFALCNSCLNPFIYVYKNKYFRQGVVEALGCPPGVMVFLNRIGPTSTQVDTPTNTLDNTVQTANPSELNNHTDNALV
ncbi:allatostatin-A receptor-like [Diadema antillarum]|uniref:allatostatin-A receptor-like n=1 Tax=Diadema antillarum TaxID=105358 RepID=UPI003A83859B